MTDHFFSENEKRLLQHNRLAGFRELWELELEWFEPPNFRRSGWSGAARFELEDMNGSRIGVFIKRQENHLRRTWRYPGGCATFRIEWQNLCRLSRLGVPVTQPLYYGEELCDNRPRAILITYELAGFSALDDWLEESSSPAAAARRLALLQPTARAVRAFHDCGYRHNCLYPKHILLKLREEGEQRAVETRLIDLEKSRRVFFPLQARIRDLATLFRRCPALTNHEKDLLLNYYLEAGLEYLPPHQLKEQLWRYPLVKWLKRRIAAQEKRKNSG